MIQCYGCKTEFDEIEECYICPKCNVYADEDDRNKEQIEK